MASKKGTPDIFNEMKFGDTLEEEISKSTLHFSLRSLHSNIGFEGDKHKASFREQRSRFTSYVSEKFDDEVEV